MGKKVYLLRADILENVEGDILNAGADAKPHYIFKTFEVVDQRRGQAVGLVFVGDNLEPITYAILEYRKGLVEYERKIDNLIGFYKEQGERAMVEAKKTAEWMKQYFFADIRSQIINKGFFSRLRYLFTGRLDLAQN